MDKKHIIGLLVKGNKARNLVNRGVKIPTKMYLTTKKACIVSSGDVVDEQF